MLTPDYIIIYFFLAEIHHLAIIGEMFILSVAALAVYWKYIRENIPLDFHHPSNALPRSTSGDFDSPDIMHSSDDGNNSFINNSTQTLNTVTESPSCAGACKHTNTAASPHSCSSDNNIHNNNTSSSNKFNCKHKKKLTVRSSSTGTPTRSVASSNPLTIATSPLVAVARRLSVPAFQRIDYQSLDESSTSEGQEGSSPPSGKKWIVHI